MAAYNQSPAHKRRDAPLDLAVHSTSQRFAAEVDNRENLPSLMAAPIVRKLIAYFKVGALCALLDVAVFWVLLQLTGLKYCLSLFILYFDWLELLSFGAFCFCAGTTHARDGDRDGICCKRRCREHQPSCVQHGH